MTFNISDFFIKSWHKRLPKKFQHFWKQEFKLQAHEKGQTETNNHQFFAIFLNFDFKLAPTGFKNNKNINFLHAERRNPSSTMATLWTKKAFWISWHHWKRWICPIALKKWTEKSCPKSSKTLTTLPFCSVSLSLDLNNFWTSTVWSEDLFRKIWKIWIKKRRKSIFKT